MDRIMHPPRPGHPPGARLVSRMTIYYPFGIQPASPKSRVRLKIAMSITRIAPPPFLLLAPQVKNPNLCSLLLRCAVDLRRWMVDGVWLVMGRRARWEQTAPMGPMPCSKAAAPFCNRRGADWCLDPSFDIRNAARVNGTGLIPTNLEYM